jgi:PAS domain S-box-containing protein
VGGFLLFISHRFLFLSLLIATSMKLLTLLVTVTLEWKTIAAGITFIGSSMIGLYKFLKWLHKSYIKPFTDKLNEHDKMMRTYIQQKEQQEIYQRDVNSKLETIKKEIEHNGGGSIKDWVFEILCTVNTIEKMNGAMMHLDNNPIFQCDCEGLCTYVNQQWMNMTGFNSSEEAHGMGWLRSIHPDDRKRVHREWIDAIDTDTIFISAYRYKNVLNGKETHVNTRTAFIRDKEKVILILGVVQMNMLASIQEASK